MDSNPRQARQNSKRLAASHRGGVVKRKAAGKCNYIVSPDAVPQLHELFAYMRCDLCNVLLWSPNIAMMHYNGQKHRRLWQAANPDCPPLPVAFQRQGVLYTSNLHDLEMARVHAIDEAKFLKGIDVDAHRADPDVRQLLEQRHCALCGVYFSAASEIRGHMASPKHLANIAMSGSSFGGLASSSTGSIQAMEQLNTNNKEHCDNHDLQQQQQQLTADSSDSKAPDNSQSKTSETTLTEQANYETPKNQAVDNADSPGANHQPVNVVQLPVSASMTVPRATAASRVITNRQAGTKSPRQVPPNSVIVCSCCKFRMATLPAAKRHYESAEHLKAATAAAAAEASAAAAVAAAATSATASTFAAPSFRVSSSVLPNPRHRFGGPLPQASIHPGPSVYSGPAMPTLQPQRQHQQQRIFNKKIQSPVSYCPLCKVNCDDSNPWRHHKKTRLHKMKLNEPSQPPQQAPSSAAWQQSGSGGGSLGWVPPSQQPHASFQSFEPQQQYQQLPQYIQQFQQQQEQPPQFYQQFQQKPQQLKPKFGKFNKAARNFGQSF